MANAVIALGSNLGESLRILQNSLQSLTLIPGIEIEAVSSWYQTKPIGPPQPDYLNGCALLSVQQHPEELLVLLQAIELQFGRVRNEKWGARTLDLDLLLYDELIFNTPSLQIPHPRMTQRAFVLVPLAEIVPDWIEPRSGKAIANLVTQIDCSGVTKYCIN
ncbi:2-amino-4-hydroxy-6-hydroxymethyldihydropteridin epyrophosphokinase [Stanieria cyanosphaera PCC 7437]|uniref:2-amino-4-hydroxy-6-hydroxymethyldihydropteridine diphosphokinase n=1 Tax=Stanieria cyanosphaera (strain ATCC 29371 / PCC 7437) TaxID=111780 RepID=K9XQI5_STAC7|nr:2-amino-4-hydroxy-6-hydroxymethyldihydropteridine diphosphokinase [Stanieria cyanosphaera]AFZ34880.1 2-amino-4-hydroxy-6-hydroxymethyldihydropteridin epyrophosphokinase [Stanieria cyanosphaera PCC 7437]